MMKGDVSAFVIGEGMRDAPIAIRVSFAFIIEDTNVHLPFIREVGAYRILT
jgi:hypothetical protein